MIRLLFPLLFFLFIHPSSVLAKERERERTYDVLHYTIDITLDEIQQSVAGSVRIQLVPLDTLAAIEVDAVEMEILGVNFLNHPEGAVSLPHSQNGHRLIAAMPKAISSSDTVVLAISYRCNPRSGLYFLRPDEGYPERLWQIWSQGEMEDNRYWLPCYDYPNDRATVEMRVTVNEKFMAISNGALLDVEHNREKGTKTYYWYSAKPFASYLISVVVGEYVLMEDWYKNIPLEYYVYPHQEGDAMRSFSKTPVMMKFFSEKLRYDYPWPKYAQTVVADFLYGGMENTSATTLTDKTIHSARARLDFSSDGLVAHELAHQWFGDLLTCRNWSHAWLNEGFASYCDDLWIENEKGWDAFQYAMMKEQQAVVESDTGLDRRPTVTDQYIEPAELFDSRIYARGACILHMLRFVMGDDLFWKGMQHYVDEHQYENVLTDDFQKAMEDVYNDDLTWFFEEWTTKAGYPELEVFHRFDADSRRIHITVRQTQTVDEHTPLYRMPVNVEVAAASGTRTHRLMIEAETEQTLTVPSEEEPLDIVFDKGNWILKKLTHRKSTDEWLYQLGHGDAAARIEALKALEPSIDELPVRPAVADALVHDRFWGVRKQAAKSLGSSRDSSAILFLAPAFQDTVSEVRVAATSSLKSFKTLDALVALGNILAADSSYAVAAEAIMALVAIDSANGMTYCNQGLSMDSHNDVIRAAAAKAMGQMKTEEAKDGLMMLTRYGQSLEVRQAAIEALARNWKDDDTVRLHLQTLMFDPTQRVQRKAIEELGIMASHKSRAHLTDFVKHSADAILKREARKAIRKIDRVVMTSPLQEPSQN